MSTPGYTDPNQPSPEDTLASRIQSLQKAHPWMDPAATVTLAGSSTSNTEAHGIADALKQEVQNTWDGISHFFDDPQLRQKETPSLALQRYITGTVGAWPIADTSLTHIQSQLQQKGFGKDLQANGRWDPGWQAALQQHAQDEYNKQIGGDKPGSKSSSGFLHSLLGAISPSGVADSVWGFVKSIPSDVRQLASDIGGTVSQAGHGVDQLFTSPGDLFKQGGDVGQATREHRAAGQVAVNNALGGDLTRQQAVARAGTPEDLTNTINDAGTVFLLTGLGSAASGISKAVGKETVARGGAGLFTRDITNAEAQRTGRVIAGSLMRPVATRFVAGAGVGGAIGGTQAELRGTDVGTGIGQGAVLGGVTAAVGGRSQQLRDLTPVRAAQAATDRALAKIIPDRWYANVPIAANTGPIIGRLAGDEGLYYRARTRLATPYQYGAVRAAGTAFSQAQVYSLKAHGVAYLEHAFGGQNAGAIQQAINSANVLDPINDALRNKLAFTIAGQHFAPDLDYLMYFLHGPMTAGAEGTASKTSADATKRLMDGYSDALGHTNLTTQVEQGTGHSYDELLQAAGGDPNRLNVWIGNKAKQAAATLHAERVYAKGRAVDPAVMPERFTDAYYDLLRSESSSVWHDPQAMKTAVANLIGGDDNYLQNYIKDELTRAQVKPNAYLKHQLGDYLDAGDLLTHQVLPHADEFLLHPTPTTVVPRGVDPSVFNDGRVPDALKSQVSAMRPGEVIPGSIGLARTTTLTSQQATIDMRGFSDRLQEAQKLEDPTERLALTSDIHDEMNAYLFHNFGLDARKLNVFSGTPEKAVSLIQDRAKQLAAEVHLTADAPEALKKAFAAINAKGYRVVAGTDIGHAFRSDLAPLADLGRPVTRARKIAQSLGLNPQSFSRLDYGVDRRYRVVSALTKAVDEGKIRLPAYYTPQTLLNDLQDDKIVQKQLPWAAHVLFSASRRAHASVAGGLQKIGMADSPQGALADLEANIASAGGIRDMTFTDFKRVLGRTDNVPWVNAEKDLQGSAASGNTVPLMDEGSIREVYKAVQEGYSQTPASMLGAAKVEDFLRYLPFKVRAGDKHLPFAVSSLPTVYARLRDNWRFTLSPYFDLRRVAKTNVKMAVDGVVPTVHPVAELRRTGSFDTAHAKLDQLLGEENARYRYLDEADKYLDSQGIFGLYNPRHYEAYYVAQKQAAGVPDEEIKAGLVKVFQYGARGKEGRSALERTTNVIFFPFSFEKTVARNVGGYLLDKPAQAMVLSNALQAYRDFSANHTDNPLSMKWIEKHTPLMEEFLRLNTFAHGISMGELGGVNRPLLNMFLPQSYATTKNTQHALERFVPVAADLHRVYNETLDQKNILSQSLSNGLDRIVNHTPRSVLQSRPVAETARAQQDDARIYASQLFNSFQQVLDYNASVGNANEKMTWGLGDGIPDYLRGRPVDKSTLREVVAAKYPAYDPLKAIDYAIGKKTTAARWLAKRAGTPQYEQYKDFYDKAQTAVAHLNRDDYPNEQAAQVQDLFRQRAIEFSKQDAQFYKFYNAMFKSAFGPLEAVR